MALICVATARSWHLRVDRIDMTVMSNIAISKKDSIAICMSVVVGTLVAVYFWYRNSGGCVDSVGVLIFYKHGPVEYMKILQLT